MCTCWMWISLISAYERICRPKILFYWSSLLFICILVSCITACKVTKMILFLRSFWISCKFSPIYSWSFYVALLCNYSLYLEEAFQALHFKHRQQYDFVIGSLIAALVGVTLNAYQARLKEDKQLESATQNELDRAKDLFQFGFVHHTSLALCAMLSVAFYKTNLSSWEWTLATVNLLGKLHIYKFWKY